MSMDVDAVARWQKLIAKIVTTKERIKCSNPGQREGSPIPGIELYELVDGKFNSMKLPNFPQFYRLSTSNISFASW